MHRLYCRRCVLFFLLGFFVFFSTVQGDPEAKHKRKMPVITTPEPDAMVKKTAKHIDLPAQPELCSPNAMDFRYREGIDVSHYQGDIDWAEVARDGKVGYVFIKATEGVALEDDMYEYNISEARRAGLKVGSYHFYRANASVDEQFANMTSKVKREMQDIIPIVDVEHTGGVGTAQLVSNLKTFLQKVTQYYGKKPILYTFVNFYNRYFAGNGFEAYPLMIAFYRDAQPELYDGRAYMIWQYTSHGDMPGIRGNVDRSVMMEGFTFNDLCF